MGGHGSLRQILAMAEQRANDHDTRTTVLRKAALVYRCRARHGCILGIATTWDGHWLWLYRQNKTKEPVHVGYGVQGTGPEFREWTRPGPTIRERLEGAPLPGYDPDHPATELGSPRQYYVTPHRLADAETYGTVEAHGTALQLHAAPLDALDDPLNDAGHVVCQHVQATVTIDQILQDIAGTYGQAKNVTLLPKR